MAEKDDLKILFDYINPDNQIIELRIQNKGDKYFKSHFIRNIDEVDLLHNSPLTQTVYYGFNPRKEAMNNKYSLTFLKDNPDKNKITKCLKGSVPHISQVRILGIDIDVVRESFVPATREQLVKANELLNLVIEDLELTSYIKVFSGNGCQLITKITPIIPPEDFEYTIIKHKGYNLLKYKYTKPYIDFKDSYKSIIEYINEKYQEFQEVHGLDLDSQTYDITRVFRMPTSYNLKIKPRLVRILDWKDEGENKKLNKMIEDFKSHPRKSKKIYSEFPESYGNLSIKKFLKEPLITKLFLNPDLKVGNRNHYLEQAFARMLQENCIDINEPAIVDLINKISIAQNKNIQVDPLYLPVKNCDTKEMVVIYCVDNLIPPVYDILNYLPINNISFKYINDFNDEKINISINYFERFKLNEFNHTKIYANEIFKNEIKYNEIKQFIRDLKNSYTDEEINRLLFIIFKPLMKKETFDYYNTYIFESLIKKIVKYSTNIK